MYKKFLIVLISLATSLLSHQTATAFDGFEHDQILYSADAAASLITIEVNAKKDKPPKYFSKQNIFTAKKEHNATIYKKTEILKRHSIETTVHMWQPHGTGFGGAFPQWTVTIKRDGRALYDASFGHNHYLDIDIYKIVVDASSEKINLTWTAEIDDSSHVDSIDAKSAVINDETFKRLKDKALGPQ